MEELGQVEESQFTPTLEKKMKIWSQPGDKSEIPG